jgi:hypothetical protein
MKKPVQVKWLGKPTHGDYVSAETYLQLLYGPKKARKWAAALEDAEIAKFAAKDQAFDWVKQQQAIAQGKQLAPILLVRRDNGGHLIIADGFHRLCAVFCVDQEALVPCKIV